MDGITINWDTLERLRARFLKTTSAPGAYWESEDDLAQYHATFATRIGWKWDNALAEASRRGFQPASRRLLDWGCGSGIASLRALAHWGPENFDSVLLWDHSLLACRFAQKTIQAAHPQLRVEIASSPADEPSGAIVLISHALNELTLETQDALSRSLADAAQILFVEPGDYDTSRRLTRQREALRHTFDIVAPCVHCEQCPMQDEANGRHWCHFFGDSPLEAYTHGDWAHFATVMAIDLRSLPYSFLVLSHKTLAAPAALPPANPSRLIGRARQFKGYTRVLSCDTHGLRDLELQKRDDKSLWKSLKKERDGTLYHWSQIDADRIKSGHPLAPPPPAP